MKIKDILESKEYKSIEKEIEDMQRDGLFISRKEGAIYVLESKFVYDSYAKLVVNGYTNTVYFFRRKPNQEEDKLVGFYNVYKSGDIGILRGKKTYLEQLEHLCKVFGYGKPIEFDYYLLSDFILDIVEMTDGNPKYSIGDFLVDTNKFMLWINDSIIGKTFFLTKDGTYSSVTNLENSGSEIIAVINMFSFLK